MKKKILVVDDDANILKLLRMFLSRANYEVVVTDDGMTGIEHALSLKPHLMILDIMMPKIDGPAIARAVRDNPETANTPIIFLTGLLPKNEQLGERKTEGGEYLFAKPFESSQLLNLIKKIIG